ncbi:MAG: SUMF1/EgtB/PvdO family nonheme iron enzyme [Candidatus Riflebacteria bacterium]|nr:SUMF1/EgtB/PvdO family nonheme iron enzyme [Candidatus Riflebacteria bacterium]
MQAWWSGGRFARGGVALSLLVVLLGASACGGKSAPAELGSLEGAVSVNSQPAKRGQEVSLGDLVEVAPGGKCEVLFDDGSRAELLGREGQGTSLKLAVPASDALATTLELARGVLSLVVPTADGVPHRYDIVTANCTASIEGTVVVVESLEDRTRVRVTEGKVRVSNALGSLEVPTGEEAVVLKGDAPRVSSFEDFVGSAVFTHPKDGSALVHIRGGTFEMGAEDGDPDEKPVHRVTLGPYSIGRTEVTWGQYRKFCRETGHSLPPAPAYSHDDSHPVVNVTWADAHGYCEWAGLRLPTEAEWEFAARGSDGRKYPWGNQAPSPGLASYKLHGITSGAPHPAGSLTAGASPFGCFDLAGNAWEWCNDRTESSYYGRAPERDPQGLTGGGYRVLRGGSWWDDASRIRVTARFIFMGQSSQRSPAVGFRVCRSP